MIEGKHYESIAVAEKLLNISRSTISRRLQNPAFEDWLKIYKNGNTFKPINLMYGIQARLEKY